MHNLKGIRILVIANALNKINIENWYIPTPSAFTVKEIETVRKWVKEGGSLFLIADHMPMGGAAAELAAAFGFHFTNGFAADTARRGNDYFTRKDFHC
jgi:carotenoid cleavage dioxygenase-like enzyme